MSLEDKITETDLCWPAVIFESEIKMATGDISVRNKEGLLQADAFWTHDAGTLSFLRSFAFNFVTPTIKLTMSLARTMYISFIWLEELIYLIIGGINGGADLFGKQFTHYLTNYYMPASIRTFKQCIYHRTTACIPKLCSRWRSITSKKSYLCSSRDQEKLTSKSLQSVTFLRSLLPYAAQRDWCENEYSRNSENKEKTHSFKRF